jgi:predicted outer membrane repeat protein
MTLFAQKKNIFNIFASIAFIASLFFYHISFGDVVMTVDDPTDTVADNGLCSIVEALINSSNGDQSGSVDCLAGDIVKTIINLETDVTLSNEWPNIPSYGYALGGPSANMVLNGNGHTISRDVGAPDFGIWRIVGVYEYEFNDVTFSNGVTNNIDSDRNKGGALNILAPSSVIFSNVTFEDNSSEEGGAIYIRKDSAPSTTVSMEDIIFDSNLGDLGGGIYLHTVADFTAVNTSFLMTGGIGGVENGNSIYALNSVLDVSESYFNNTPSANHGGAFYLDGSTLEVYNSVFDRNFAARGGAFYLVNSSVLESYNNFFNQNQGDSGGGVIYSHQTEGGLQNEINFYHNTALNSFDGAFGGGIFLNCIDNGVDCFGAEFGVQSYIFENNIFDTQGCDGNITDAIFTNNLGGSAGLSCGTNDDVTNTETSLEDNGGQYQSFALLSGSNAIDTAVPGTFGCPDTDGRGVPRPYNSVCDIGAYEYTGDVSVAISESGGSTEVSESGTTDTYTITLGKGPTSSVTVNISESDSDIETSPSSVTFTTLNWFTPQVVTISAIDNEEDDGDRTRTISHSVSTSDVAYTLITPSSISVLVSDDDSSGSTSSSGSAPSNPVIPNPPALPVVLLGCTNSSATNYASWANTDNGSCLYPAPLVLGCTNSNAINYNPQASASDGSCIFEEVTPPEVTPEPEVAPEEPVPTPPEEPILPINPNEIENPSAPEESENLNIKSLKQILLDIFVGINIQTEDVKKTAEPLSALGVVLPTLIFIVTQPAVAASIPIRLWSIFPTLLGLKRRKRPWGTVYDSVTKQPLDPVHITLFDESGKEVATTITDLDGRFGFLVPAGKYKISAHKDSYEFPSRKMLGKEKDELYGNLYFNEYIEIKGEEDILIKNIPMDSVNFNWNEFEKGNNKKLMKFYSKRELFFANISSVTFYAGVISSIFLMFTAPAPINLIIFGIYVVVFLLRLFGLRPKKPGYVFDASGYPLSFGIIKIFSAGLSREVAHAVIGKTGKYYSLVPNGEYYMKILKKTGEDQYIDVHTTEIFKVSEGYIKEKVNV